MLRVRIYLQVTPQMSWYFASYQHIVNLKNRHFA